MTMTSGSSFIKAILAAALFIGFSHFSGYADGKPKVSIVVDIPLDGPGAHGLAKLAETLNNKGISFEQSGSPDSAEGTTLIVVGKAEGNSIAASLLKRSGRRLPDTAEGLSIWKTTIKKKPVWVINGFDEKGIMYGLLEISERISWSKDAQDPFSKIRQVDERPAIPERALSLYTMNRRYWESRFYDENYWTKYLDMLAKDRFNMLTIIFGYENGGFLAPPYPYFFDVAGFPDVRMEGLTAKEQQRNLAALNNIVKMAHDRGIGITLGIWDHIYRGGVQAGTSAGEAASDKPVYGLVSGLNGDNLIAYTKPALAKLIKNVPGLDAIQFRMHDESGLKKGEQRIFWKDLFKSIKKTTPDMKLVLRAKGLPDSTIQDAIDAGVNFSLSTKYWMEQTGLPYHPTHINRGDQTNRRQGYADMLRYPQKYKMAWGLWTGGTNRILLWGDPDYASRFVTSLDIYGDHSFAFDVNEPLATKMESQPHDEKPFDLLSPPYRYYEYEFERYWYFYSAYGRMGYDPKTPADVWLHEFEQHFGENAGPIVEKAITLSSKVLPRIIAACNPYAYFPTTRGWVEKQRLGGLADYAKAEGSDIQQFANFDEEAQLLLNNGETAKIRPSMSSVWFRQTADSIQALIRQAQEKMGTHANKEFNSTMIDLKILANLSLYHSRKIPAAVYYCLYKHTHDAAALDSAIFHEENAIAAWKAIVSAAGNAYAMNLKMGLDHVTNDGMGMELSGHWKDELDSLEKDLAGLQKSRVALNTSRPLKPAPHYKPVMDANNGKYFDIQHQPVLSAPAGKPIKVAVKVASTAGIRWVRLQYRNVNQYLDFQMLPMKETVQKGIYEATVPAEQIDPGWDFMYLIEIMDEKGRGFIYPNLENETPYVITKLLR